MTDHENRNPILNLYFHEGTSGEERRTARHIRSCPQCRDYQETLARVDGLLSAWEDEIPAPDTLEQVLNRLPSERPKAKPARASISFVPIFEIAAVLVMILAGLFGLQSLIYRLPLWKVLEQNWIVQSLGSFGVTVILFFVLGTFITLCLAPVLLLETRKNKTVNRYATMSLSR
jgi:predicted anti-sigma-YlaC factor YlaD